MTQHTTILLISLLCVAAPSAYASDELDDSETGNPTPPDEGNPPSADENTEVSPDDVAKTATQPLLVPPPTPVPAKEREGFFKSFTIDAHTSHWKFHVLSDKKNDEWESKERFTRDDDSRGTKIVTHKTNWDAVTTDEKYDVRGILTYGGNAELKTEWFTASAKYSSNNGLSQDSGPSSLLDTKFSPDKFVPGLSLRHHDLKFETGTVQLLNNGSPTSAEYPFSVRMLFQEVSWQSSWGFFADEDLKKNQGLKFNFRRMKYETPRRLYLAHEREVIDDTGETVTDANKDEADELDTTKTTTYFPYDNQLQIVESNMTMLGLSYPFQTMFLGLSDELRESIELEVAISLGWGPISFLSMADRRVLESMKGWYAQSSVIMGYQHQFGKRFSVSIRDELLATNMGTRTLPDNVNTSAFIDIPESFIADTKKSEWSWEFGTTDLLNQVFINAEMVF